MSYDITYFTGNHRNTKGGKHWNFESFEELADEFNRCAKGGKFSAYIVRGKLKGGERKDENLKSSKLLIIDGDEGLRGKPLCSPKDVHSALVDEGINHFIYTSHSHSKEQNKFRVVIASTEYTRDDLRINNKEALKLLAKHDCKIKHVKEMNSFSQPWFVPTRDDPEDGMFEAYKYTEGKEWEALKSENNTDNRSGNDGDSRDGNNSAGHQSGYEGGGEDIFTMHENIRTGKEYHQSILNLSYQLVKQGFGEKYVSDTIKSLMSGSSEQGTERWQERYNNVDRVVAGAVKRINDENSAFDIPEDEEVKFEGELPIPPGLMGKLYHSAYDSLLYQYPEVALVSSLGLLAGVCGRKFNVMEPAPSGLNLFLTIVAGTGFGKESISTFINKCVRGNGGLKEHRSFIGPSNFTGPKAIVNSFMDARSRVCVVSEAGLMMKVKSGNVEGKTAFILDAFSTSHRDGYTKESSYSNKDDYVAEIRSMAITIISESTEDHMIEAYKTNGSLTDGHLPRQLILKIDKRQTEINRRRRDGLPEDVRCRLDDLMAVCSEVQSEEDSDPYEIFFEDDVVESLYEYITKYNELNAEYQGVDPVKHNMATRVAQKAVRLAGLCAVFNSADVMDNIRIGEAEWTWAKSVCDYEFDKVSSALSGLSGNEDMDNAIQAVYAKMASLINNTVKNKKCGVEKGHRDRMIIPISTLKIACASLPQVKLLNDSGKGRGYQSGLDKVVMYMEQQGVLTILKKCPLGGRYPRLVQIREGILDMM